ncbi:glycoside hydrolase family 88/105 protein [Ferdinandcohnia quinoae]|uniref:Glycoside hydrolase family 88 protein n=1 Tax=Fredinandcohnia quinoae TaxID=2918902 RepID=A0AAW5DXR1_9BACI|nr:glycoside hydrolase family 88 protein [Fredinandcohnia sp. SECRCQ15]MCH1625455.1 glycoside hydrolase family 88 protein [Fredinandcohnia sp. SECRCQ15]
MVQTETLQWAQKMADSVMVRTPFLFEKAYNQKWSYDYGVVLKGFELVWKLTGDRKYFDYMKKNMDFFINEDGNIRGYDLDHFNIDHINNGKVLLTIYKETKEERYKKAIDLLREQLSLHPRTSEMVFWHKKIYPYQIWLDGLYMGAPFYAEYVREFGDAVEFSDITKQFLLCAKNTEDPKTGLLYHAFDEKRVQPWCDPKTGLSKNFWGRSMGWFVMGLVDTLDIIPNTHPDYPALCSLLEKVLIALNNVQDKDSGVWYQVLDQGGRKGNYLEASASAMILYGIAKGVRLNILGEKWQDEAKKVYEGVITEFITVTQEGLVNLNKTCQVAGLGGADQRDGTFEYYISEPIITNDQKGVGAFILAAAEMEGTILSSI